MNQPLSIKTKLTYPEYRAFNLYNLYTRPTGILLTFIGLMMWGVVLLYLVGYLDTSGQFPLQQLIFAIGMTVLVPGFTIWKTKRIYDSNIRFKEEMVYTFDETWIQVKGESFESKLTWEKMYKIKETKSWFLIYQNKIAANVIPKKGMNAQQLKQLRSLIKNKK